MPWPQGAHTVQYYVRITEGTNETSFGVTVDRNSTINPDVVHDLLDAALQTFRDNLAELYPGEVVASGRLYSGDMPSEPWPAR